MLMQCYEAAMAVLQRVASNFYTTRTAWMDDNKTMM